MLALLLCASCALADQAALRAPSADQVQHGEAIGLAAALFGGFSQPENGSRPQWQVYAQRTLTGEVTETTALRLDAASGQPLRHPHEIHDRTTGVTDLYEEESCPEAE